MLRVHCDWPTATLRDGASLVVWERPGQLLIAVGDPSHRGLGAVERALAEAASVLADQGAIMVGPFSLGQVRPHVSFGRVVVSNPSRGAMERAANTTRAVLQALGYPTAAQNAA